MTDISVLDKLANSLLGFSVGRFLGQPLGQQKRPEASRTPTNR
jgi:hypothetical protein